MDDKKYLKQAVDQAKLSVKQGGFPAGAVIVKNGKVISTGISIGSKLNDPTAHAEITSIREACKRLQTRDLGGAVLYASLQPCLMCFSVASWANISKIVYGCNKTDEMVKKEYYEGTTNIKEVNNQNNRSIEIVFLPYFEKEILRLIQEWEKNRPQQVRSGLNFINFS